MCGVVKHHAVIGLSGCSTQGYELDRYEAHLRDARIQKYAAQRAVEEAAERGRQAADDFEDADAKLARCDYEMDEQEYDWVQSAIPFVLPKNSQSAGASQ